MANTLSIEAVNRRLYVVGNSYAVKDQLKAAGCKWDGERKQWWIGSGKRAELEAAIGQIDSEPAKPQSMDDARVYGKVSYTGKSGKAGTYYVIGRSDKTGTSRLRLTNLAGSIDFWVDESVAQWVKRYEAREVWDGRYRSGNTHTQYQTLCGLRSFIDRAKRETPEQRADRNRISECGGRCRCAKPLDEGDGECMYCGYAICE